MMNLDKAREIVAGLRRNHRNLSLEAIDVALEQLEIALTDTSPQPDTLSINVSDEIKMFGNMG